MNWSSKRNARKPKKKSKRKLQRIAFLQLMEDSRELLRRRLYSPSLMRQIIQVEELPPGAY